MFTHRFNRRPARVVIVVALAAVIALLLVACGGESDTTETTGATTETTSGASATTMAAGTVNVTLADVSANSMLLTPSPASAPAGTVTFVVTNSGTQEHEFVVLKTDLAADNLPFDEDANEALEEGEGVTPIDEIESIMPGETKNLVVDLEAGHYALICNLEGHYKKGMLSDFDVS
jgi:uncharacterized cupredoxin-like copper-binding protein